MQKYQLTTALTIVIAFSLSTFMHAQNVRPKVNTRVFWQDAESQKLSYGDVVTTDAWSLRRGWVTGFPTVDAESQRLGPMQQIEGKLLVGLDNRGNRSLPAGWVGIDSGVFQEPHGNHFHWKYTNAPVVRQQKLDPGPGGPTGLFVYNQRFFVASEQGFTRVSPAQLSIDGTSTAATGAVRANAEKRSLAAVNNVCYTTWSDSEGENAGRVDVINMADRGSNAPAYSFKLPTGEIEATTANNGKVFFAHDGAISWLYADTSLSGNAGAIQPRPVTMAGNDPWDLSQPPQSLVNARNWVLFCHGSGERAVLGLINAAAQNPQAIAVPIQTEDGLTLSAPATVLSLGKRYALVFQIKTDPSSDIQEQLTIIELDPNRDNNFVDARVKLNVPVRSGLVEDQIIPPDVGFDAYGRFAIFTSPGESRLNVMTMNDLKVRVRFNVGGAPSRIVAVGAPEHFH